MDADQAHLPPNARIGRGATVGLGVLAVLLLAGGWLLPLWQATLQAPQYPGGLSMYAYGHQVTGDVDEISGLNHYVGMRPFDLADFPEMVLWPYTLVLAVGLVVVALVARRRLLRTAALVVLWGIPVGVLAVIQFRLYQYGTDLDPGAALRLEPFVPLVIGPTRVWNFTTWSWPGWGLVSVAAAAAVVTFGPRLVLRLEARGGTPAAALLLPLMVIGAVVVPVGPAAAFQQEPLDRPAAMHGARGPDEAPLELVEHPPANDRLEVLLAAARPGERILLPPGTYDGPVVIDVPVVLVGHDLPLIQGDGTGTVLTIRAPGTVVRGIAVRGSGPGPTDNPAGISIEADEVTIEGVLVEDAYMGLSVEAAAGVRLVDNTIRGRADAAIGDDAHAVDDQAQPDPADGDALPRGTSGRGDGIWLYDVDHVLVRGNHIEAARDGVYLSFGSGALIDGNRIRDSRYAVHSMFADDLTLVENHLVDNLSGAVLMYRGPALLLRNHIERSTSASTGFAVLLKDVTDAEVVENVLHGNRVGLHLDGPAGGDAPARFVRNTVAGNAIGVSAYPSSQGVFGANSFADNLIQVLPQGGRLRDLVWSDRGFGNHWSSYRGYDAVGFGRGAVPHLEGGAVDRLLTRHPELIALADAPALRLLRSIEERWGRRDPVLVDELPITRPMSPMVPSPPPQPTARTVGWVVGLGLTVPALLLLWLPRRRAVVPRRSHVVVA
jgi:nitrous oxidase accessory protein